MSLAAPILLEEAAVLERNLVEKSTIPVGAAT
jgi:hypothetical protein